MRIGSLALPNPALLLEYAGNAYSVMQDDFTGFLGGESMSDRCCL
jgi:hypothetical protein